MAQPGRPGLDNTALSQPRFTVEAIGLKAVDETGFDFFGSDEIVARFTGNDQQMFTRAYGSMDRGENHAVRGRERCIYPAIDPDGIYNHMWSCRPGGGPAPVTVTIDLYEYDGLVRGLLTNPLSFCLSGDNDILSSCDPARYSSTSIGSYRLTFTAAQLVAAMPNSGMSISRTLRVDNCSRTVTIDNGACAYWSWLPNYAAYDVTIRVTRQPNVRVEPPVLEPR